MDEPSIQSPAIELTDEEKALLEPSEESAGRGAFLVATILCALFLAASGLMVLQLRDADRAEDRLAAAIERYDGLAGSIEDMTKSKAALESEHGQLVATVTGLRADQEGLEETLTEARGIIAKRSQAMEELNDYNERIRVASEHIQQLQQTRNALMKETQEWRMKRDKESDEYIGMSQKKLLLQEQLASAEAEKRRLDELRLEAKRLEVRNAGLQEEWQQITTQNAADQKRLDQLRADVAQNQKALEEQSAAKRSLITEVDSLTKQRDRLQADVTTVESRLAGKQAASAKHSALVGETEALEECLQQLKGQVTQTQQQLTTAQTEHGAVQTKLNTAKGLLASLSERESVIQAREAAVAQTESAQARRKADVASLTEQASKLRQEVGRLESTIQSIQEREARVAEREKSVAAREAAVARPADSVEGGVE